MSKKQAYFLITLLAIIWGSSFILMKEGLKTYDNYQVAALRMVLAGISLLPFLRLPKGSIAVKDYKYFVIVGVAGNALPAYLFTTAQTHIDSSLAGALNSLTPLFTLLIGVFLLGVSFNKYKATGVLIGLAGALMLIFGNGFEVSMDQGDFGYAVLAMLAAASYGISVNVIKYKLASYPPIMVAALPLALMAVPCSIFLLFYGLNFDIQQTSHVRSAGAIIILAFIGTALSLVLFNKMIKHTSAVFASSVTYLIPIVALIWGFADGEQIALFHILGLGLILTAIYLVKKES